MNQNSKVFILSVTCLRIFSLSFDFINKTQNSVDYILGNPTPKQIITFTKNHFPNMKVYSIKVKIGLA